MSNDKKKNKKNESLEDVQLRTQEQEVEKNEAKNKKLKKILGK